MKEVVIAITAASYSGNKGAAAMLQSSIRQLYEKYGTRLKINLMSVYPEEDKEQIPWDFIRIVSCKPEQLLFIAFPLAVLYKVFHFLPPVKSLLLKNKILRAYYETDAVLDEAGISFVDSRGFVMNTYGFVCAAVPMLMGTPVLKYSQAMGTFHSFWNRFLASQIAPARFKAVNAGISNGDYLFKATGSKMIFDGFLKVYQQGKDGEENNLLPHLEKGEQLELVKVEGTQNFTQPPARFTEASLVKDLEDKDIGRPSTYAPIVATLMDRKYVTKDKKSLMPTELGFIVIDMMQQYFKEIVDTGFTAQMEENLDDIEAKGVRWKSVIEDFYGGFKKELDVAEKEIQKVEFEEELTGETCEKCGRPMAIKHGRFGAFAACTGYPECKNTKPIVQSVDVKCPQCGKDIVMRRSKRGRIFYGCSGYPDCTQSYWNKPVNKKCPKCCSLLVEKKTKEHKYACSNSECDYKE